jgi:hypothetical protein
MRVGRSEVSEEVIQLFSVSNFQGAGILGRGISRRNCKRAGFLGEDVAIKVMEMNLTDILKSILATLAL